MSVFLMNCLIMYLSVVVYYLCLIYMMVDFLFLKLDQESHLFKKICPPFRENELMREILPNQILQCIRNRWSLTLMNFKGIYKLWMF